VAALGDLLEALYATHGGFESVASRWRIWTDHALTQRAMLVGAVRRGEEFMGVMDALAEDAATEEELRFWSTRDGRRREERADDENPTITIVADGRWWTYDQFDGAQTGELPQQIFFGDPGAIELLLMPAPLLGLLRFDSIGEGTRLERPTICARATPIDDRDGGGMEFHSLGDGADEYVIEVDRERGTILRLEARLEGEAMIVREALEIAFDVALDPDLFTFVAPDGSDATVRQPIFPRRADMSLEEAGRQLPFAVFALRETPPDWQLTVVAHQLADERQAPALLFYVGAQDQLTIQLSAAGGGAAEPRDGRDAEAIEGDGQILQLRRATREWPQTQVTLDRDGTRIALASTTLAPERLVEYATQLVRVAGPG
jgi:hypothetical protein